MTGQGVAIGGSLLGLSALWALRRILGWRLPPSPSVPILWTLFLFLAGIELVSFRAAAWLLAIPCFVALREYFSLIDLRPQDRWAIFGAYLTIPFMIECIRIDWYGMFIISIPVYGFLVIPFLVALGGREARGTVVSIGAIDFGLFLFVYCVGHIGYLARLSLGWVLYLVAAVVLYDLIALGIKGGRRRGLGRTAAHIALAAVPLLAAGLALADRIGLEPVHAAFLAVAIPLLAAIGRYTIAYIEADLGIKRAEAVPGRGEIIDGMRSFLYAAPVAFHYLRYFAT